MRLYLEVLRLSIRRQRAYRAANVASLLTNTFFGVLRSFVFIGLYQARPVAEGYDLADAITFAWLTQGLIAPVLVWGWQELALTIRTGEVATDLSRPWDYFGYWLSRDLGRAAYHVVTRSVPTVLLGALLFGVRLPEHAYTWLLFLPSLLLAVITGFCIRFMINVSGFWTTDIRGLNGIVLIVVDFLTGFLVPLAFFPSGVRDLLQVLPFAGMIYLPVEVFLEHLAGTDAVLALLRQAAWVLIFVGACRALVGLGARKLVVQGG